MADKDDIHAFLGFGAQFTGRLRFKGMVRVDCHFQGTIESEGTLVLGERAHIEGEIRVAHFISSGKVVGDVHASEKAGLQKTAKVLGNIATPFLEVQEGALFDGMLSMKRDPAATVPPKAIEASVRVARSSMEHMPAPSFDDEERPGSGRRFFKLLLLLLVLAGLAFAAYQAVRGLSGKGPLASVMQKLQDRPKAGPETPGRVQPEAKKAPAQPAPTPTPVEQTPRPQVQGPAQEPAQSQAQGENNQTDKSKGNWP